MRLIDRGHLHNFIYRLFSNDHTAQNILAYIFAKHAEAFDLGLRDQLQIANIIEAAFLSLKTEKIHVFFLIFLAVIYQQDPAIFRNVSKARNLHENTGVMKLYKANGLGQITVSVPDFNPFPQNSPQNQIHTMLAIAQFYFKHLELKPNERNKFNTITFPENLMAKTNWDNNGNPSFAKYFDIIQHAGNFSGKK